MKRGVRDDSSQLVFATHLEGFVTSEKRRSSHPEWMMKYLSLSNLKCAHVARPLRLSHVSGRRMKIAYFAPSPDIHTDLSSG